MNFTQFVLATAAAGIPYTCVVSPSDGQQIPSRASQFAIVACSEVPMVIQIVDVCLPPECASFDSWKKHVEFQLPSTKSFQRPDHYCSDGTTAPRIPDQYWRWDGSQYVTRLRFRTPEGNFSFPEFMTLTAAQ